MLDDWMALFNNPMDEEALENREIRKALEAPQYLSADEKVREAYDSRNDAILYEIALVNVAEARGIEKGKAEGEKIGEHKKSIETAKNFLAMGLTVGQVAKGTGLSIEEIKKLRV